MPETDPLSEQDTSPQRPLGRICLLLDHNENRRLLRDWLDDLDRYRIVDGFSTLDGSVDLCIVDARGARVHGSELSDWKEIDTNVFTPCLLASERGKRTLNPGDESLVDDVVELPVGRAALERRLDQLLMQREQSLELDDARQTLREQNERLQGFARRLAHDMRNPLGIVTGYVDVVQESHPNDEAAFEAIESGLERMQRLVDETLMLAKMGQTAIDLEPVSLRMIAERAWGNVGTADATLTVREDARIEADKTRLEAVFENLYRNAVEHGGSDVSVEVGLRPSGFCVADDGPGIPDCDREQVFEVGYTTNEDGTGFGLRIVREIVDAHGWSVTISESEMGGAQFEINGIDLRESEDTN